MQKSQSALAQQIIVLAATVTCIVFTWYAFSCYHDNYPSDLSLAIFSSFISLQFKQQFRKN